MTPFPIQNKNQYNVVNALALINIIVATTVRSHVAPCPPPPHLEHLIAPGSLD